MVCQSLQLYNDSWLKKFSIAIKIICNGIFSRKIFWLFTAHFQNYPKISIIAYLYQRGNIRSSYNSGVFQPVIMPGKVMKYLEEQRFQILRVKKAVSISILEICQEIFVFSWDRTAPGVEHTTKCTFCQIIGCVVSVRNSGDNSWQRSLSDIERSSYSDKRE